MNNPGADGFNLHSLLRALGTFPAMIWAVHIADAQVCPVSESTTFRTSSSSLGNGSTGNYGAAVAASGDTVLVGARWDGPTAFSAFGRVEVIQFDGSQWNVVQSLQASGGANGDRFGASVAI